MKNNLPIRKSIRLKTFDYGTTAAYFITICVKEKRKILSTIVLPESEKTRNNANSVGDGALDVPFVESQMESDRNPVEDGVFDIPQIQLTKIGEIIEKYLLSSENIPNVEIDEYVIMPDHIHAIIFIKSESYGTSRAPSPTAANETIPHIVSTFKRFCNKEIGENIFQRSYYDHIIRDRQDYEIRKKYIYENPVKWYYDKESEDIDYGNKCKTSCRKK